MEGAVVKSLSFIIRPRGTQLKAFKHTELPKVSDEQALLDMRVQKNNLRENFQVERQKYDLLTLPLHV